MNAMKAVQLTLTVSGVSVNVTLVIPRNGVNVKVTGEQFHKHKLRVKMHSIILIANRSE